MTWKADNVRAILFPAGPPADVMSLWSLLGLGDAETFQKRVAATGIGHAAGAGAFLIVQPGRVELRLAKVDPEEGPQLTDNPESELDRLSSLTVKLLESFDVNRVACCADLIEPKDSIDDASKQLASVFPGLNLPGSSQDIIVQLNVQKPCASAMLQMNRLCRWGVATQALVQVEVAASGGQQFLLNERVVYTFSLDLNTAPQPASFTRDVAKGLFAELVAETKTLLTNGYGALK